MKKDWVDSFNTFEAKQVKINQRKRMASAIFGATVMAASTAYLLTSLESESDKLIVNPDTKVHGNHSLSMIRQFDMVTSENLLNKLQSNAPVLSVFDPNKIILTTSVSDDISNKSTHVTMSDTNTSLVSSNGQVVQLKGEFPSVTLNETQIILAAQDSFKSERFDAQDMFYFFALHEMAHTEEEAFNRTNPSSLNEATSDLSALIYMLKDYSKEDVTEFASGLQRFRETGGELHNSSESIERFKNLLSDKTKDLSNVDATEIVPLAKSIAEGSPDLTLIKQSNKTSEDLFLKKNNAPSRSMNIEK